jgi:protein O-GlcNAc transferase
MSTRSACALFGVARSSLKRTSTLDVKDAPVMNRMAELAAKHPRFGYRRVRELLRREGAPMSSERALRLWQKSSLQVPKKRRRRVPSSSARPVSAAAANQVWAWDFVHDACANGQSLKCLTVVDENTRECLAIDVAGSIRSERVIEVLARLVAARGAPAFLRSDNGPEFVAQALQDWLRVEGIRSARAALGTATSVTGARASTAGLRGGSGRNSSDEWSQNSESVSSESVMVRKLKGPARPGVGSQQVFDRDAHLKRAADHYNAGRHAEAIDVYAALCTRDPRDATAWFLRGLVRHESGDNADAERCLRVALECTRKDAERHELQWWLGRLLRLRGARDEACAMFHAAARGFWGDVAKLHELAIEVMMVDAFDTLEPVFARILELDPDDAVANGQISLFDLRRRDFDIAFHRTTRALARDPDIPAALRVLGHVRHDIGEVKEGAALYARAIDATRRGKGPINVIATYESMLGALVYADVTDDELRTAHERWKAVDKNTPRSRKPIQPRADRPLRIGYVSPDFRNHAVAFFFEPLLHNHDANAVTTVLYSNASPSKYDDVTTRIREVAQEWRDISSLSDVEAADLIERDGIDILVDLAGYTIGNRMGVFHARPAPIQINYLGYPCTTGLSEMDYRFTDEDCDPLGVSDEVYTEKLVRLPGGFYAWRQPEIYPAAAPPPALKNGRITFGSLNTLSKITDDVIALWSQLMNEVPGSRLILQAEPLTNAWVRRRLLDKFASHGVADERIVVHGIMPMLEHLELYNQIDIALDPFPWGGHTTTCMAAFMSVPVVTLRGRRMASRMSASVLHRMGFDAWIADTPEQYIQIAKSLAADVDRLATIRLAQRTVFAASGLMDGHRLARVVEAAYQAIWDHHAGEA